MPFAIHKEIDQYELEGFLKLKDWRKDRVFDPIKQYFPGVTCDRIEARYKNDQYVYKICAHDDTPCKNCGQRAVHDDVMIVAADGACKVFGTEAPKAAIGVFFGLNNHKHNKSLILRSSPPHNAQKAELIAGLRALQEVAKVHNKEGNAVHIVIVKADSECLVKGMTEWILKWRENGFVNSKGKPVANADLYKELDQTINELNQAGVGVLFWHVPKTQNEDADWLANVPLDKNYDPPKAQAPSSKKSTNAQKGTKSTKGGKPVISKSELVARATAAKAEAEEEKP